MSRGFLGAIDIFKYTNFSIRYFPNTKLLDCLNILFLMLLFFVYLLLDLGYAFELLCILNLENHILIN